MFIWKNKVLRIVKIVWKRRVARGVLALLGIRIPKTTVINLKLAKNYTKGSEQKGSPEMNLSLYELLVYDKGGTLNSVRKES